MYTPINDRIQLRLNKLLTNLAEDFSLETLSKSPARFNQKKLDWFNQQYIRSLSLEEFVWRCYDFRLKTLARQAEKTGFENFRLGNYAYFIDFKTERMLVENCQKESLEFSDGGFYPVGGGQDEGESEIDGLIREVREETLDKVVIDPKKAYKIADLYHPFKFTYPDGKSYLGRDMNIYIYPVSQKKVPAYEHIDEGSSKPIRLDWYDFNEVVEKARYLHYAIWREQFLIYDLPLPAPSRQAQKQYLAYLLDQNRITTLAEFGLESKCVLDWQAPDLEIVKWKKISLEESLDNLRDILPCLQNLSLKLADKQEGLYKSIFDESVKDKFTELVGEWEAGVKAWLTENQKQVGNYLWPLRVALSGQAKSPSPFELLAILDWSEVENRVNKVLGE